MQVEMSCSDLELSHLNSFTRDHRSVVDMKSWRDAFQNQRTITNKQVSQEVVEEEQKPQKIRTTRIVSGSFALQSNYGELIIQLAGT